MDWLGNLPEGWGVVKAGRLFSAIFNGLTADQLDATPETVAVTRIETISTGEFNFQKTGFINRADARESYRLRLNDFQFSHINSLSMIGNCAQLRSDREIYGGMNLLTLRPRPDVDARFVYWILKSGGFRAEARQRAKPAINQASLPQSSLTAIKVPVPSLEEQHCIAAFLDAQTAKVDALIAKQEQLIATLGEDRTATITHAVTHGLNANVHTVDAGVWLGDMPEHWTTARLRDIITSIDSGVSVNGAEVPAEPGEVGVLKASCVTAGGGVFRPEANKTVHLEELSRVSCPVRAGTLVVNRANTADLVGSVGYVSEDIPGLYLSDLLWAVSVQGVEPRFLHMWMQTSVYRTQVAAWRSGFNPSMQKLAKSSLRTFVVALPPADEQRDIVAFVTVRTTKIDALIAKATEVINTLREYRSALITDAVTGKIDVLGAG